MPTKKSAETKKWRVSRFNLSDDGLMVVEIHPQAKPTSATGYVVLKFEAWTTTDFRRATVDLMNRAEFPAVAVDQRSVDHYAGKEGIPTCRPGWKRPVKTTT
jgi:hypothetical protein